MLNRLRSVVERLIAHVKTWRILDTGFRRLLGSYRRVFSSGAGVGVFGCWSDLMNKPHRTWNCQDYKIRLPERNIISSVDIAWGE